MTTCRAGEYQIGSVLSRRYLAVEPLFRQIFDSLVQYYTHEYNTEPDSESPLGEALSQAG